MSVLYPVIDYLTGKQGQRVTLQEVMTGVDRPRNPVLRVLDKLTEEGYLNQVADRPVQPAYGEVGPKRRNPTWKVVADPASRPVVEPRKNTLRQRIWHLIRSKRRFVKDDLVIASGAAYSTVDQYVREFERAGAVRKTGKDGAKITYLLSTTTVERPAGARHGRK